MAACATLALAGERLLIGLGVTMWRGPLETDFVLFYTTGLLAAAPLLIGGALARRRLIVCRTPLEQPQSDSSSPGGAVLLLPQVASAASPQQMEWKDTSPHQTTLVTVEDDVRLEVLDWGGAGPALLLLAGLSDTAHVFDDIAPTLARRYRVVGVTRRGHPRSSAPATGYGPVRLAEDVVRVMDKVGLKPGRCRPFVCWRRNARIRRPLSHSDRRVGVR